MAAQFRITAVLVSILCGTVFGVTVTHETSDQFSAGTFSSTEDTGSGSSPAIKLQRNIDLGTGANGAYVGTQPMLDGQYTDVTINGACTPAAWNGSSGGIIRFKATGTVTINTGCSIDVSGRGYRGGITGDGARAGSPGESYSGRPTNQTVNPNGGGGGGTTGADGGGGGGGYGSGGGQGQRSCTTYMSNNGGTYGDDAITTLYLGSGGGSSGSKSATVNAAGGAGGGAVQITAGNIIINGAIRANGAPGEHRNSGGAWYGYAGGGGSGGSIKLIGKSISIGGSITATGGAGQDGWSDNHNCQCDSGAGGVGRIRCEYVTIGGSGTSPGYSGAVIPYKTTGTYNSPTIQTTDCSVLGNIQWVASGGTSVQAQTRTSPDGSTWSAWSDAITTSGSPMTSTPDEYLQYRVTLTGTTSSTPTLSSVSFDYTTDAYPTAFDLLAPADTVPVNTDKPTLSWSASSDPDGLGISYTLQIATSTDFVADIFREVPGLGGTSYTPGLGEEIAENIYYWRVIATDGVRETHSTQTWQLVIDTTPPAVPVFSGLLLDLTDGGQYTRIYGTGDNAQTLTVYQWSNALAGYEQVPGNTTWAGTAFTFSPATPIARQTTLYAVAEDVAHNLAQSRNHKLAFTNAVDIFQDTVTVHSPGSSVRMEQDTSHTFKLAANAGQQVNVAIWVRTNNAYGAGIQPSVTLSGPGISGPAATASLTAGPEIWQQLMVAGTPSQAAVLTLTVQTFSTEDDAKTWIDDVSVSQ